MWFSVDKDGRVKPAGLRHAAYKNFLNMCALRNVGKSRRFALPACVILRVRQLYPSHDGKYTDFKLADNNTRI